MWIDLNMVTWMQVDTNMEWILVMGSKDGNPELFVDWTDLSNVLKVYVYTRTWHVPDFGKTNRVPGWYWGQKYIKKADQVPWIRVAK